MSDLYRRGIPKRPRERTVMDFREDPDLVVELTTPEVTEIVMTSSNVLLLAPPGSTLIITLKKE